jgi:hypothetical protein
LEVELDRLFPHAPVTHAGPGLVVFLERAGGKQPTHIQPLDLAEAQQRFDVVWSWEHGWKEEYEHALSQLLAQGSYRLLMNGTPWEAVEALEGLIATRPDLKVRR